MAVKSLSARPGRLPAGVVPGSVIAGYRVESRIGAGAAAVVFRAWDVALGRTVALKVIAPELAAGQEFRQRFTRASRAADVIGHPHVIPVLEAGDAGGVLYLALPFVPGDLRALVQREGPLPAGRAASLLSPLASALDAAHAAGLVHGDVKPANVLVDVSPGRPGHPYLSEFGPGTAEYLAPEQAGGKPPGPRTDQYALACVACTMLTGTAPFTGGDIGWAHLFEPPPAVTASRPELPADVDAVLARAMAKDPAERYPTCTDFTEALRGALGVAAYPRPRVPAGRAASTGQPATGEAAGTTGRRLGRRLGIAAAAVVLLAGSAAAALLATPAPQGDPTGPVTQQGSTLPGAALTDPSGSALTAVAFKSDSDVVAIDAGGSAYEWNLADNYPEPAAIGLAAASVLTGRASAISPDGRLDATAGSLSGGVQVVNVATSKVAFTLASPEGSYAQALAFSPDGTELAAAYPSGTIYIWAVPR